MDIKDILTGLSSFLGQGANDGEQAENPIFGALGAFLNVDADTLEIIVRLALEIIGKRLDIKDLLPSIIPAAITYFTTKSGVGQNKTPTEVFTPSVEANDDIQLLKSASQEVFDSLDVYLQSQSAVE
ncbi:MAG: hypothetical protein IJ811_00040 [Clostridia bacterium]|nr:hypothetical protein [Clostridia bacterium]